ncbi:MAG: terminase family protein [Agrobacterium cavarae]
MASQADALMRFDLHPKQMSALESIATEILYGGAAGGGKSHLMRIAAILWCTAIGGLQVYLFRRIREDLVKNHVEGPSGFRSLLAGWVECGFCVIVEDEIRFWNGSKIYLCHCKDEKDRFKYQGAEIHVLLIDELTHFTDVIYRFLRNRVRMIGLTPPPQYRKMFPRIICGANPGGIGHQFVKATFIDGVRPMQAYFTPKSEGGMLRQYIPARLEDNPSLMENDPGYEARLHGLGSDSLVRAMRYGDWDIIDGAFFDNFRKDRHVIKPFPIPKDWLRFRAGDWGSAKPFSFGWYAVATEPYLATPGVLIPRGAMIRYREWYGIKTDAEGKYMPNQGLKMTAEAVGTQVRVKDGTDRIEYGVLDPAAFAQDGGPSIAERMMQGSTGKNGSTFRAADNKRVPSRGAMGGWDQMRSRLEGDEDGRPMLFFFETCIHAIRTIPALMHDQNRPEDLDSDMEDHAADEVRYACMSRPWVKTAPEELMPSGNRGIQLPLPPTETGRTRIAI